MCIGNKEKKYIKNSVYVLFFIIAIGLTLLRFYMEYYLGWHLILKSNVDDEMQVNNAASILRGEWMGEYSNATIPKHPMYPIFLAITHIMHIPYPIGVAILICASSVLFTVAIKPLCENRIVRTLFYLFLIYNPIGFASQYATRIYRNSLIPWAVLLVVASMFGLYLRKDCSIKKMVFWSVMLGISVSFFWFLREDSIWILPFLLAAIVLLAIYLIRFFFKISTKGETGIHIKKAAPYIVKYILLLCLPFFILGLTRLGVCGLNKVYYGIFVAEDRVESSIGDVMSNLYRIDDGHNWKEEKSMDEKDVLVSSESIRLAQEASPTLARLDNLMDCYYRLSGGEELWADWPEWALRDAAAEKGYYQDALDTETYFAIVADELEKAFDEGRLKKREGIYLSSQTGAFQREDFIEALNISVITAKHIINYDFCEMGLPIIHYYNADKLSEWEWLLKITIPRKAICLSGDCVIESDIEEGVDEDNIEWEKYKINNDCVSCNLFVYKILSVLSLMFIVIGFVLSSLWLITKHDKVKRLVLDSWIIEFGTLLTAFLNVFVVCLFSKALTSNPDLGVFCFYSSSCYILLPVASIIGACVVIQLIRQIKK